MRRARAKAIQDGDTELVKHIDEAYQYDGIDTCAVDSMCVTACPVKIDTGKFIKSLRRGQAGATESAGWAAAAKAWGPGNTLASAALTGAYYMPTKLVQKVTDVARAIVGAGGHRVGLGRSGIVQQVVGQGRILQGRRAGELPPLRGLAVALAHVPGQLLQVRRHHFIRVRRRQRHAHLPKLAALQQREALALGQADDVRRLDHRHAGHADAVLGV